ncbi:hypothetical protein [Mucilaginibacter flavus]|uniref:hypothetical protein n=1 Tax=Mucilaginibacter flavus TaxID=931504 RepID=UPI0025B3B9FC|nr:hypothetical protein [Mucilaginibacter flavus]MDN3583991.1 hypothetical protein [Mucilaginibacter flavus]
MVTVGASAGANVVGGAINNAVQGKAITAKSVITDAAVGVAAGFGGRLLEKTAAAIQVARTGKALTAIAADAKAAVTATGLKEGEKGFGTAAHTQFKSLVDAQGLKGVATEQSYLGKDVAKYGIKGSTRAEVTLSRNGAVSHVFDFKTGSATLSTKQVSNTIKNVPEISSSSQVTAIR